MDITITGIPEGAVANVKEMAAIAVERFLRARDVKVEAAVITKFEADIDKFREDNLLTVKFETKEEVV